MRKNWPLVLLFIGLSVIATPMMIHQGQVVMPLIQDLPFHLSRMLGLENVFQSPVNFQIFNHNGVMMTAFYPWLFVLPWLWIYQLVKSLYVSYGLYVMLLNLVTLWISYVVGRKLNFTKLAASGFAILYTFSYYRIFNIYERQAVGEIIAMTFMPLLILGIYDWLKHHRSYVLALVMSLLLYSHFLSAVMAACVIALAVLIEWIQGRMNRKRWLCLFKAVLWAIGLAFAVLGTLVLVKSQDLALQSPRLQNLASQASPFYILIRNAFVVTLKTFHISIGLPVLLLTLWLLTKKKMEKRYRLFAAIGLICFFSATTMLPWNVLQKTPLVMIQFPWRFLGVATLMIVFVASGLLWQAKLTKKTKKTWLLWVGGTLLFNFISISTVIGVLNVKYGTEAQMERGLANYKSVGKYDYLPQAIEDYQDYQIFLKQKVTANGKTLKTKETVTDSTVTYQFNLDKPATVAFPQANYRLGLTVTDHGKEQTVSTSDKGCIQVKLKAGEHQIQIRYHYVWLEAVFVLISLLTLILFCYQMLKQSFALKKKHTIIENE